MLARVGQLLIIVGRRMMFLKKAVTLLLTAIMILANIGIVPAAAKQFSKLVLSRSELVMEIGDTASLTATAVYTDGSSANVTINADWSSDNATVATVYNGIVSAKNEGTATIVAIYQGQPQSVKVVVSKKVKALTKDRQSLDLRKGESADIAIMAVYSDNTSEDVTDKADWTTGDANIATVVNGTVQGHSPGSVTITAKYGSQEVTVPVNVEIVRRLTPDHKQVSLLLHDTFTLQLIATYPDGTTKDVAADAEWSSSDEDIADAIKGVVTAYGAGTATLTAKYGTKSTTISVDVDKTRKLTMDRQDLFLHIDDTHQLVLTATYPNGVTSDVTQLAKWSSSDESVAAVSNGLVDGLKTGTATIKAEYGNKSLNVAVDVETARFLQLSHESLSLKVDQTVDIALQATYVDGSTEDVTGKTRWSSNNEEVAYVLNNRVYARTMGEAIITASYGGKTARMTVDVDVPRKLSAEPKSVALQAGEEKQIKLVAVYGDGREELVTDKAEWLTSDEEVAVVNQGLITAVDTGTATVTAKYGSRTMTIKTEVGLASDLSADSGKIVIGLHETKQIVLTAKLANGATKNVTGDAKWVSSSPSVADVTGGLVKAYASGATTITAEYGGKTVSIPVEVDLVQKLELNKNRLSLKSRESAQLILTATYSDGSKKDVSADAEWKANSYKVVDVKNGLVTGVAYGRTTITAKYGMKSVTIAVDVDTIKYLQTDIVVTTMKVGTTKQIKAIATYGDGIEKDVTREAVWSTSRYMVADAKDGLIRAHSTGKVTITVDYGGKKSKVVVTVTK